MEDSKISQADKIENSTTESSSDDEKTSSQIPSDDNITEFMIDRNGGYDVRTETLNLETDNGKLYTVFYIPENSAKKRPAVIFSHGFGDTNRGGQAYAQALAAQGYLVVCFDFRGGGTSSKSDGSTLDMTLFTEQQDLEAELEMLSSREDVDLNYIFLLGNSQGGVVSVLTAAAEPDKVRAVALSSPAFSLADDARKLYSSVEEIPSEAIHIIMNVGHDYFSSIYDFDPIKASESYNGDVLIFHGDKDDLVPISYSQRAVQEFPNATLEVLQGEGHMYSESAVKQTIDKISDFFYRHLDGSADSNSDKGNSISNPDIKTGITAEQIYTGENGDIHYSYYLPESYDGNKKFPMMVVMPGYDMMWFGESSSGSNLNWSGFLSWTKLDTEMIVVSAQLTDWHETSARQAVELTEYFVDNFAVDTNRVYAAGYSAGGETMSQAVSMRPDLYAAYLHGASQWDGTYDSVAENKVAVYIYMAESDEYYGSAKARSAYDNLHKAYKNLGYSDTEIDSLLRIETPDDAFFNEKGIYNYHGGANVVFDDSDNLNWIISHSKG